MQLQYSYPLPPQNSSANYWSYKKEKEWLFREEIAAHYVEMTKGINNPRSGRRGCSKIG